MTIGEKIKTLRESLNMTQEELAKRIHVTKQTIFKYENGIITNIPMNKITVLAESLGTTPSELLGWDAETLDSYKPEKLINQQLQTELKHLSVELDSCPEEDIKKLTLGIQRDLVQLFNQKRSIDAETQLIFTESDRREYQILESVNHLKVAQSCAHKIAADAGRFSEYLNTIIKERYFEDWQIRKEQQNESTESDTLK